jgi:hypothetical protein
MPRYYPRNAKDSDSANMKATLISAIRGKNQKHVEQLLNRDILANTGPHMHSLKKIILAHDKEIVRLLCREQCE